MNEPDQSSSDEAEEFQARYGLEPTMVENLLRSQEAYRKMGIQMSLEAVYEFEIGKLPEDEECEEE